MTAPARPPEQAAAQALQGRGPGSSRKAGNQAGLDFRLLFADIRPTNFRDAGGGLTAGKAQARLQEQQLERQRQARRPREQDQIALPQAEMQRAPDAGLRRAAERTEATRSATGTPEQRPTAAAAARAGTAGATPAQAQTAAERVARDEPGSAANTAAPRTDEGAQTTEQAAALSAGQVPTSAAGTGTRPEAGTRAAAAVPVEPAARGAAAAAEATPALASADKPVDARPQAGAEAAGAVPADEVKVLAQALQAEAADVGQPVSDADATQLAREAGLLDPASQPESSARLLRESGALRGAAANPVATADASSDGEGLPSADGDAQGLAAAPQPGAPRPGPQAAHVPVSPHAPKLAEPRLRGGSRGNETMADGPLAPRTGMPATAGREAAALPPSAATLRSDGQGFALGLALPPGQGHSPVRNDGSPLLASRIDSPVNSPEFREQFARQLASLTVQGQDRAEIRLTPAELGPIRIRVSLAADDAMVDISAAHAATRAAIEASMPTLRQMLAEQGLRLADYRMDQGSNPSFLAQHRQGGQEHSSGMQQSGTAFGQGNAQSGNGQPGQHEGGSRRGPLATNDRSAAVAGSASGMRRDTATTLDGRLDLFA